MDIESTIPETSHVVHPEVRAYIYSLVTALGGAGTSETGQYVLGDDALAVLRDIKKWLKFYDERMNRMDVARCLAEAALVNQDLVPILAQWSQQSQQSKHLSRIATACSALVELLVPLTWPIQTTGDITINHARHIPYLQHAHGIYKWSILSNSSAPILRAIIRIALPSISTPAADRSSRDEGILKLMLYFFRNIAIIDPGQDDESQTSRSATITAFQEQDVFALLLTMCSNIESGFAHQDIIILDIIFHLLKGVDPRKVFGDTSRQHGQHTDELAELLDQEAAINRGNTKNAPTRHGRFGTMIWVKRDEAKLSTVSGQDVLRDGRATLLKMDKSKQFNKPRGRRPKEDISIHNFAVPCKLTSVATKHLRTFVEEFIDSGFNPLFVHIRKATEREAERITEYTRCQFFYLIGWFLLAERLRRLRRDEAHKQNTDTWRQIDPDDFRIVAGVLNQETFIALNRHMRESLDNKEWRDVNATVRCFSQILLTVHDMSLSPLEEDQEIAENIQNRIFYEEETHDRVLKIIREYKDQGFSYLDACTELSHVFLTMLEHYSKSNAHMQVRYRRSKRRKKKQQQQHQRLENRENAEGAIEQGVELDSEEEDAAEAQALVVEKSFEFKRFAARFTTQKSVDTFVTFLSYYRELDSEQLKRAHRFFYRVAFKQEMAVLLFRVDIVALFYKIIKGPQGLDSTHPNFTDLEELIRHILRKMIKRLKQRPELFVEMLFSKINSTVYFLDNGYERLTVTAPVKEAAELEVKPGAATDFEATLGIVVSALLLNNKKEEVEWLAMILQSAIGERRSETAREEEGAQAEAQRGEITAEHREPPSYTIVPHNESLRLEMMKNGHLKLLLALVGATKLGIEDNNKSTWIISSSVETNKLEDDLKAIQTYLQTPLTEFEGKDPRDHIRRKRKTMDASNHVQSYAVDFGDDSEGVDEMLFPPNPRERSNGQPKKKPTGRTRRNLAGELDDETREQRRLARKAAALARQRKIKSDLYMHYSDDDSEADAEFFAQEELRRKEQARSVRLAALLANDSGETTTAKASAKRKRDVSAGDESEDTSGYYSADEYSLRNELKRPRVRVPSDSGDAEMLDIDKDDPAPGTPRGQAEVDVTSDHLAGFSQPFQPSSPENPFVWSARDPTHRKTASAHGDGEGSEVEEDDLPVRAGRRPRVAAGFVIDSDSE
ncbi:Topoisomerase 1-associated factor 1 [Ascosphaera aggregata]|nr:Topoisomerase 1-associated factor 1 [Ascosphaera aggregata]